MINIGHNIHGYTVQAIANGVVLAHSYSAAAPAPYAVWTLSEDGCDVRCGSYFERREDAEWDFCGMAFAWFADNAPVNMIEDSVVDQIKEAQKSIAMAATLVDELNVMLGGERAAPVPQEEESIE